MHRGPIIIIEDDKDDQEIYEQVFSELGSYRLIYFTTGEDAFSFLMTTAEKPFIIFSDINMPKLDGLEMKKKIDETDYLRMKSIPFIFITTSNQESTLLQAYQKCSIQGYFRKPDTISEMKEVISYVLGYWELALHCPAR